MLGKTPVIDGAYKCNQDSGECKCWDTVKETSPLLLSVRLEKPWYGILGCIYSENKEKLEFS